MHLLDSGGNTVVSDSSTIVESFLVPSLGPNTHSIVEISSCDVPTVIAVNFVNAPTVIEDFVPGDVISLEVVFSQEVIVSVAGLHLDAQTAVLPCLELNIYRVAGNLTSTSAQLIADNINIRIRNLFFEYVVAVGDSQTAVDVLSSYSLSSNDYVISGLWGRPASLVLPIPGTPASLLSSASISVDDSVPFIVNITTPLDSDEYGAGHDIPVYITFSRRISITGAPRLPIVVRSTVAIFETVATSYILVGSYFVVLSDGLRSEQIPWDATSETMKRTLQEIPTVVGQVCVSRSSSPSSSFVGHRWVVRFEGQYHSLTQSKLDIDTAGMSFSDPIGSYIAIEVETLSAPLPDWSSNEASDSSNMCTSRFAEYSIGSGTKMIQFVYKVSPGDAAEGIALPRNSLAEIILDSDEDSICLASSRTGMSPVPASISFGDLILSSNLNITVDTSLPKVLGVRFQTSTTPVGRYAVGDTLFIDVIF